MNLDGAGEGFNDPNPAAPAGGNPGTTFVAQRLIAFQYAANLWGAQFDSTVDIRVRANFDSGFPSIYDRFALDTTSTARRGFVRGPSPA